MVPMRATLPLEINLDAAFKAMTDVSWLGRQGDRSDERRVATDLELPIRDGSAPGPVRKAALISIGPPRFANGVVAVGLSWESATMAPLFPIFTGELTISAGGLALDGQYAPPFGRLGLVIDSGLLRFVAHRTAQAFLARIARHLQGTT